MAGTALELDYNLSGLSRLEGRIKRLTNLDRHRLLETMGGVVESQTRRRIETEKESPDGKSWDDWSPRYAKTRHGGHTLLMNEGDLHDSIQFLVTGGAVEIGSNLIYAAPQQFGLEERNIPDRPFLGISADNGAELEHTVDRFLDMVVNL